jgi:hypothetical protein
LNLDWLNLGNLLHLPKEQLVDALDALYFHLREGRETERIGYLFRRIDVMVALKSNTFRYLLLLAFHLLLADRFLNLEPFESLLQPTLFVIGVAVDAQDRELFLKIIH